MKTTREQIDLFRALFCNGRADVYGSYYLDSGRYLVVKEPVTDVVVAKHLEGRIPLGVFMLKGDTTAVGVVDVDRLDMQLVDRIVKQAEQAELHCYVERSKGKGYHIWFLLAEAVPASIVRQCIRSLLIRVGAVDAEVFPKQDSVQPGDFGNFVNCPLFGKHVQEGRTVFVDSCFEPYANQWDFLKSINRSPRSAWESMFARLTQQPESPHSQNHPDDVRESSPTVTRTFGLLPCATKMLDEGVKRMQRSAAFRLGVALKKAGLPLEATVSVLLDWAKKNRPDDGKGIITAEEIEYQVSCSYRRPYAGCGCSDPAVIPFCDPKCCLKVRTSA